MSHKQWAASVLDHVSHKKHKSARTKECERGRCRGGGLKSLTNTKLIENSTRRYTKTNRQRERKAIKLRFTTVLVVFSLDSADH